MDKQSVSDSSTHLLIVDDVSANLAILKAVVCSRGSYTAQCESSGEAALSYLSHCSTLPALILMDIIMPGLSGIEILRIIRNKTEWALIPVILLTGEGGETEEEEGLAAGANDFVHKPIKPGVLLQRIRIHLEMRHQREKLEELAKARAESLIHSDRMATLGLLSAGAAHEINNPNTFIAGNLSTLDRFWTSMSPLLQESNDPKIQFICNEMPNLLNGIRTGVDRISRIVGGLKSFARSAPSEKKFYSLQGIVFEAMLLCANSLKRFEVIPPAQESTAMVLVDAQQIEQILANLLTNAADALEGKKDGRIEIILKQQAHKVILQIVDNGPGIPSDVLWKIWDPFFTTKPLGKGTGLGLSIAQGIAEEHGGSLDASNSPDGGAVFTLTLPLAQEAS